VTPTASAASSVTNTATVSGGGDPDCVVGCDSPPVETTINAPGVDVSKTVQSFDTTGPGSYRIVYRIDVTNSGSAAGVYTLSDTFGFPSAGVGFIGNAQVSTTGGTVNAALVGGAYAPANGVSTQISEVDVGIAIGATHTYVVAVTVSVNASNVTSGACTGSPGSGLFNTAAITGSANDDSSACQPLSEDAVAIRLTKTVELGVDFNNNRYGDVGDVLGYAFVIENLGETPLAAVSLFDPMVLDLECDDTTLGGLPIGVAINDEIFDNGFDDGALGVLQPGDSVMCFATHTLTAADVAARRVYNSATATGAGPDGEIVSSVSTAIFGAFP
jgi:hypothetical protein